MLVTPHVPMQEAPLSQLLHNSNVAAPVPIIADFSLNFKYRSKVCRGFCVQHMRCGVTISCAAFIRLNGSVSKGPGIFQLPGSGA